MRTKTSLSLQQVTRLGGLPAGTAWALGIAPGADGRALFLGSAVGLYRAASYQAGAAIEWERLPNAPIGIISLAVSPAYSQDKTLLAGTNTGVFVSSDGGDTWQAGKTPIDGSVINAISFSPGFEQDAVLLAGTLEDGMLFSNDRGLTWHSRNFGLLDAAVFSAALSPDFASSGVAFIGTDTAVYHTYNGGRAWKLLNFPDSAAPIMSLAVRPGFAADHTVFAGTEAQGLYRSTDAGASWESLALPAACINALAFAADGALLAATDSGVFRSDDRGEIWTCIFDQSNIISLAATDGLVLAGLADRGAWLSTDLQTWQLAGSLSARPVVGLAVPAGFEEDGLALMFGPAEGIWRTVDSGSTWEDVNDELPTLDVRGLAVSPNLAPDQLVAAASQAGVLISQDGGRHWNAATGEPAERVVFSPNGKRLAASFSNGEIRISDDLGVSWRTVSGAWEAGGKVAALAVGNADQFYVAVIEGIGETLSIWQGQPGAFEKVHSQAVGENPVAAFWIPTEALADRPWFAGLGNQVLKISSRKGRTAVAAEVFDDSERAEAILMLAGVQGQGEQVLLAATGRHVYKSADGQSWTLAHDFGNDRAVTVCVSPNYLKDRTLYALLIGGTFARLIVR